MAYAIGASIERRADTVIGPYMPNRFSQLSSLISKLSTLNSKLSSLNSQLKHPISKNIKKVPAKEDFHRNLYLFSSSIEYLMIQVEVVKLHLDFYFNTAREFELHQSINSLRSRAVDIDKTLVSRNFELFA